MNIRKNSRLEKALVCVLLFAVLVLFLIRPAFADEITGTAENQEVRVGIVDGEDEENKNFQIAYFKALAQYAGWKCEFVPLTWDECLNGLKNGKIDFLSDVSITEERSAYMDFSAQPMGTEICYMYGSQNTALSYNDFKAFNGIRVGYEEGSTLLDSFQSFADASGFTFTAVPYKTDTDAVNAMNAGDVDVVIQTNFLQPSGGSKVLARCGLGLVYIAASKAKPELKEEMDNAMMQLMSIHPNFSSDIHEYYFGANYEQTIGYTAEEKAYLESKPVVTCYYEVNWEPFEYEEKSVASGITPDLLRTIGEETGITFRFETTPSTKDQYASINSAGGDTVMAVSYDYLWADDHGLQMTQPYVVGSVMRVTRTDSASQATVAVVKDTYLESRVTYYYPELRQTEYLTTGECMDAVASGKTDCTFINSYQATDYRAKSIYSELSYKPEKGLTQGIALGVTTRSSPVLFGILSKAIYGISADSLPDILSRNSVRPEPVTPAVFLRRYPVQSAAILAAVCAAALVIIFLCILSAQQKKQNLKLAAAKQDAESAKKLADEANAAKSDFLSRMSHDMRTPLNGIIGMTYLARDQENPERTAYCLTKIDLSSKYLLGLINDVLDMSKAESGSIELHPKPYSMSEFKKYVDAVIRPLCEEKSQKLIVEFVTPDGCVALVDKLRMNQIIFNLLSNAVKYSPRGSVIRYQNISSILPDGRIRDCIEVTDQGIGMSPEFQKVLFEPFTQENRVESSELHGTGLGLAITKKLVDAMGGTIRVESQPGKGTMIHVELMLERASAQLSEMQHTAGQTSQETALTGKHILLCEDHPMNQEIAKALLTKRGLSVDIAENGAVGVKAFENSAVGFFDCILMDIRMPVMNGYEAARAIRSLSRADAKSVPILAMTADAFSDDVQKCLDAGMNGHIAKPIDPELLYKELSETLIK